MTSRISLTATWTEIATGASIVSCEGAIEVAYSDTAPGAGDNGHDLETESDPLQYPGASKTWARARWPGSIAIVSGAGAVASIAPQALVAPQVTTPCSISPANPSAGDVVVVDVGTATGVPSPTPFAELEVDGERVALDVPSVVMPRAGNWSLTTRWYNGVAPNAISTATGVVAAAGSVAVTAPAALTAGQFSVSQIPGDPNAVNVRWTVLPDDGGAAITEAYVDIDSGNGAGAPILLSGLAVNTDYRVPVLADTPAGIRIWFANGRSPVNKSPVRVGTPWTAPVNTWTTTVVDIPRDREPIDSGAVLGLDRALVPYSGVTPAPVGSAIEARAKRLSRPGGAVVGYGPWMTIATVGAGGAWSGQLIETRQTWTWSVAEIRVAGSSAPAVTTTNRFTAAHKWAMYEQSNWNRIFTITESLAPVAVDDPDALQIVWADRNPSSPTLGVATRQFVTDATPVSASVVAMANVFAAERPGEILMIAAHTQSGTSPQEMIQEPQTGARKWAYEEATHDMATATRMYQVGLVLDMGWVSWNTSPSNAMAILPILTGKEIDGTVRAPGAVTTWGTTLTHDLREFYDYSYTRLTFCGPHGKGVGASKTSLTTAADGDYEGMVEGWRNVMRDNVHFPEILYCADTNDGALRGESGGVGIWSDIIHHHGHVDWGQNRLARLGMMNALRTAGLVSWSPAVFDRVHWAPDATKATFWISTMDVTTERNRMGGVSPYVRGWTLDGQIITTAQLVPNAGGSGRVGVEITCPAGYTATSPGAVAGRFTYSSILEYGKGELPGFQTYPTDYETDYVLDLLVADVGAAGMPAMPVRMRSAASLGNTLSAPQAFVVDGSQYFTTTSGLAALGYSTPTQYRLDFVGSIDGSTGGDQRIAAMGGNGPVVSIGSGGAVKVTAGGSGTHQHSQVITWGQVFTLTVLIDQPTRAVTIILNGAPENFAPATMAAMPTGQALAVLATAGGGNAARGTIQSVAVRINDLLASTAPLFLAAGNGAAVTAAHGPTGTGWLRGTLA